MALVPAIAGTLLAMLPLVAVLVLWVLSLYDQRWANVVYKLHLLRTGLAHMLFSTDRKWKRQPDADDVRDAVEATKEVFFVRHGESKWNLVFNKGFGALFPGRLGSALAEEGRMVRTLDSVFVDSPLSEEGCDQARGLAAFVESCDEGHLAVLKGLEGESVLVSSNLRRALSTCTIGMWERIQRSQEKIHILSALQEVTFNIDGVALAKPHGSPELAREELGALGMSKSTFVPERYYNALENEGDKPVQSHGIDRLKDFAAWCFERDEPTIIAAGHSLWFRYFFDTFLPRKLATHEARKCKMANCSVVSFTLQKGRLPGGKAWYRVDPDSLKVHYLDFEKPKKRKQKAQ